MTDKQTKISKSQAKEFAYAFCAEVRSYAMAHLAEYKQFLESIGETDSTIFGKEAEDEQRQCG